jgi:hypothetical protein
MTSLIFLGFEVADAVRGIDSETQDNYEVVREIWGHSCLLLFGGVLVLEKVKFGPKQW